jgi:hypothetical protein
VSDTVFVLGAGASAEAGAPVMSNFFDVARELERQGRVGAAATEFRAVFKGIRALSMV